MPEEASFFRSFSVACGITADIILNYPLWVGAKRKSVGLSLFAPTIRQTYKGGLTLFFSLGPTTVIEDFVTNILHKVRKNSLLFFCSPRIDSVLFQLFRQKHQTRFSDTALKESGNFFGCSCVKKKGRHLICLIMCIRDRDTSSQKVRH